MSTDEKDKRFDDVLGWHVQKDLRRRAEPIFCPDTNLLAAYHERSLAPEEMNQWKEHIGACGRCQEILATLEETESILVGAEENDMVAAMEMRVAAAPRAAAAQGVPMEGRMVAAAAPQRPRRSFAHWRWLAPAGAIAAGILVWVAVHEKEQNARPVIVAENRTQPAREPSVSGATPAAKAGENDEYAARAAEPKQPALHSQDRPNRSQKQAQAQIQEQSQMADAQAKPVPTPPAAPQAEKDALDSSLRRDTLNAKNETGAAGQIADQKVNKAPEERMAQKESPAGAAETADIVANAAPAPTRQEFSELQKRKTAEGIAAGAAEAAPRARGAFREEGALLAAQFANKRMIAAPGGKVQWIVGAHGLIRRLNDGGKTSTEQTSGVSVDLVAGSAPSETVCWVVGQKGTILLTTDGEHWMKIESPTTADLIGVSARDAKNAAVWSDPRLPRYVTSDGGMTWTQRGTD